MRAEQRSGLRTALTLIALLLVGSLWAPLRTGTSQGRRVLIVYVPVVLASIARELRG